VPKSKAHWILQMSDKRQRDVSRTPYLMSGGFFINYIIPVFQREIEEKWRKRSAVSVRK
jgi:hypothetical protein